MRRTRLFPVLAVLIALIFTPASASRAQWGDLFKGFKKAIGVEQGLSEDKIIEGLKEALRIGSTNAVNMVSETDGYFKNPKIKIPLPAPVQNIEKIFRATGYG